MKKNYLLSLIAIFIASFTFAQTGFNYKALITDSGNALANQSVTLRFTVLENGTTAVYQETKIATTDANGIVSTNIGEGTVVSGDFNTVNWASRQSLKVEIDSGSGYQDFGTNPLKWVPTAKYASKAGSVDFSNITNVPTGLSDGDDDTHLSDAQIAAMGYIKNPNDADHDASNELQDLTLTGTQLSISNGNHVNFTGWDTNAADDFSGNYTDLANKPDVFRIQGTTNPATSYTDDIKHGGDVFIGDSFASNGIGKSSLRINRRINNKESYGLVAIVGGSGTENHYGGYFELLNAGSGVQYGVKNVVGNTGNGSHYGSSSLLSGSGSGIHYGAYNNLSGTGAGFQFGVRNYIYNSGNGNHFGTASRLTGSGSGDKYGTYAYIHPGAGGTHYAIYGDATKAGSYAGYFVGDVYASQKLGIGTNTPETDLHIKGNSSKEIKVEATNSGGASKLTLKTNASTFDYLQFEKFHTNAGGSTAGGLSLGGLSVIRTGATANDLLIDVVNSKNMYFATDNAVNMTITNTGNVEVKNKVTAPASGDADMKAYIYGNITAGGNKRPAGSSDGYTISRTSTGVYEVIFNSAMPDSYAYTAIATISFGNGVGFIRTHQLSTTVMKVYTYDTSGNPTDKSFNFVVYKK